MAYLAGLFEGVLMSWTNISDYGKNQIASEDVNYFTKNITEVLEPKDSKNNSAINWALFMFYMDKEILDYLNSVSSARSKGMIEIYSICFDKALAEAHEQAKLRTLN